MVTVFKQIPVLSVKQKKIMLPYKGKDRLYLIQDSYALETFFALKDFDMQRDFIPYVKEIEKISKTKSLECTLTLSMFEKEDRRLVSFLFQRIKGKGEIKFFNKEIDGITYAINFAETLFKFK